MIKYTFAILITMLFSTFAFAATPYSPEVNRRFKALEAAQTSPTLTGISSVRVARATFDSTTMGAVGTYPLGVTLPANTLFWDGVIHVDTAMSGSGSVALQCEDAANLLAAATVASGWGAGVNKAIIPVGTAAAAVGNIAAACPLSVVVSTAAVVGKFTVWVEYFVTN